MRLRLAYIALCLLCPLAVSSLAHAQSQNPAEAANPPENPAPTGPAVPSDVKQPPPPHKPFDFTVYGRVNVSFDVGNQELTTARPASRPPSAPVRRRRAVCAGFLTSPAISPASVSGAITI